MRYSKLAPETIEVLAASPSPVMEPSATLPALVNPPRVLSSQQDYADSKWFLISLICAVGWLCTVLAWWWFAYRAKHIKRASKPNKSELNPSLYQARQQLKQACLQNEAGAVQKALLAWGKLAFKDQPPTNLQQLTQYLTNTEFVTQVQLLQQQLYAHKASSWSATALWAGFEQALKENKKNQVKHTNQVLQTLYPVKTGY